jgi:hypothetical protein
VTETREKSISSPTVEQMNEECSNEREVPDEERRKAGPIVFPNERETSVNFIISAFVRTADAEGDKVEAEENVCIVPGVADSTPIPLNVKTDEIKYSETNLIVFVPELLKCVIPCSMVKHGCFKSPQESSSIPPSPST